MFSKIAEKRIKEAGGACQLVAWAQGEARAKAGMIRVKLRLSFSYIVFIY